MAKRGPKGKQDFRSTQEAMLFLSERITTASYTVNLDTYKPHFKQDCFHRCIPMFSGDGVAEPTEGIRGITKENQAVYKHNSADVLNNIHKSTVAIADSMDTETGKIKDWSLVSKVRQYIGGNRSGKTVAGLVEALWWLTKRHPYIDINAKYPEPIRGRLCTTDFVNGWNKVLFPMLQAMVPLTELEGGSWEVAWDKQNSVLSFKNGSFLEVMSYEQAVGKFASASRHFVMFDEEPPEDIYIECMARLIDTMGCAWLCMTPTEGMSWTYDKIYEPGTMAKGRSAICIIEVDMYENPHVSAAEKEAYLSLLDDDEIAARKSGRYVQRGGLIFSEFTKEAHVINEFIPSTDFVWAASMDHGLRNPTAWLWHAINREGRIFTFYEHYASGLLISEHAKVVNVINGKLGKIPDYYVGDPAIRQRNPETGASVFEEYAKYGIFIMHDSGLNDMDISIARVKEYLKVRRTEINTLRPYWLTTSNCTNFIWEMQRWRWANFATKHSLRDNNPKEKPVDKDNHAIAAARYLIMSRPDLRTGVESVVAGSMAHLGMGGTVFAAGSDDRLAGIDPDLAASALAKRTQWTHSDYSRSGTEWVVDEYLGGEY